MPKDSDTDADSIVDAFESQEKVLGQTNSVVSFFHNLWNGISFYNRTAVDPVLTKKLNDILQGGGNVKFKQVREWVVRIIPASTINAFVAYPYSYLFDPGKGTIFLYGGLVKLLGRKSDDLMGVILHEVGHFAKFHLHIGMGAMAGKASLSTLITTWLLKFVKGGSGRMKALMVGSLLILATVTLSAAWGFVRRTNERSADDFVIQYGYGKGLAGALVKMNKFGSISGLKTKCGKMCQAMNKIDRAFSSHPQARERVKTLLNNDKIWKSMQKKKKGNLTEILMTEIVKMVKEDVIKKRSGGTIS